MWTEKDYESGRGAAIRSRYEVCVVDPKDDSILDTVGWTSKKADAISMARSEVNNVKRRERDVVIRVIDWMNRKGQSARVFEAPYAE